jgi:hypothetical protein
LAEFEGGGHAHADEVFFVAAGGDGAGRGGSGQDTAFGDEGGGGDLEHHAAGFQAGVVGEEGRESFAQGGVDEAVNAAFADAGQGGERNCEVIHGKGQVLAVEIASGEDLFSENEGIIRGGIQFYFEDAAGFGEGVEDGSVDLGGATEGVGVLHAAAGLVGFADFAAFEEFGEALGAAELAGVGADGVDARVKGFGRAFQGVEREGAGEVGGGGESFGVEQGEGA